LNESSVKIGHNYSEEPPLRSSFSRRASGALQGYLRHPVTTVIPAFGMFYKIGYTMAMKSCLRADVPTRKKREEQRVLL